MKIAIIGIGAMGGAILKGYCKNGQFELLAMNPDNPRVTKLTNQMNIDLVNNSQAVVDSQPDAVILTTPAPVTVDAAKQLAGLSDHTFIISAAAGVSQAELKTVLPHLMIANIIPNTPVAVNAGTIGLAMPAGASEQQQQQIRELLSPLGDLIEVPEDQLDIVGVVGGCGPAFVDVFMDAMSDSAVLHGMSRQTAYQLVASMVKGSGALATATKQAPALLRDQVTSPGGTTIRGVAALEKDGFRHAVIDAVDQATK